MRQSKGVGEAEAVALHGGHPGGSGKSPSTKGFPHGPVLRGRQSKDILFWCGSSSGCRLQRRRCRVQGAGCRVDAECRLQSAFEVRAVRTGRPPSETRRRVCHLSSGDQHRSSKKRNPQPAGPCAAVAVGRGARAVRWVRPLSRQGISTACPLGTDLGMSGSSSASKGGGQCGGRGAALGGADFSERATARAARACAGEGAVPRPHARLQRWGLGGQKGLRSEAEGAVRRQGSARRRGEGRGEGSEISCGVGSPHPRVSGVGIRVIVLAPPHPPHPTAHRRVGVLASYKWV